LKVDRGKLSEVEQLWASGITPQAIELLTMPSKLLTEDVPPAQRISRELMDAELRTKPQRHREHRDIHRGFSCLGKRFSVCTSLRPLRLCGYIREFDRSVTPKV
jgi:hypothetical protein